MKNAKLFFPVSTENHGGYRVHTLTKFRSPDNLAITGLATYF